MKTRILTVVAVTTLLLVAQASLPVTARAQVPGIINYQGRVVDAGTNFTGMGQFQFALVNGSSGTTNYWSNDGTAAGQPSAAVSLTVTKGLYSVLLGDTTIANMSVAVAPAVFANSDVRLRVWFNDGTNGFQQLVPDQRVAAAGYALSVANVQAAGDNTFVGVNAGNSAMSGNNNTANGYEALQNNTSGTGNTASGAGALQNNTTGDDNTAFGVVALVSNTNGNQNTASGEASLGHNTSGNGNTAMGFGVLYENTTGSQNTAVGQYTLGNATGNNNTAVGTEALFTLTTGDNNIALGSSAGDNLTTGDNNIDIGNEGMAGEAGIIRIGTPGTHTATYLAGTVTATAFSGNGAALSGVVPANGSVGSAQLSAGAVGAAQIAAGAVGTSQIAAGSISNAQLAAGAVMAGNIANGAVGPTQLAGTVVTNNAIGVTLSGNFTAANGLVIETRTNDPSPVVIGQIWLRTDL